jgi:MATE family multidrug resistance protein
MDHPFIDASNYTLISMALAVLLALVAEPLTGLVETVFISRMGSVKGRRGRFRPK